jgi:pimeloyl-ACP methyl ester carboxylesterase
MSFFLFTFLLTSFDVFADKNSCPAFDSSIRTLTLPHENIEYKYRYLKYIDSSSPVIIFLPGGPGSTSIQRDLPDLFRHGFSYIQIDPRGVGCNRHIKNNQSLTSKDLANDVLEIVKKEKINKYILHGISYGTMVATITAALSEERADVPSPIAVVLEGTLGRRVLDSEENAALIKEWSKYKKQAPQEVLNFYKNVVPHLDVDSKDFASFITTMLSVGRIPRFSDQYFLDLEIISWLAFPDEFRKQKIEERIRSITKEEPEELIELYRKIACDEFISSKYDPIFENNDLVLKPSLDSWCKGISVIEPYESSLYQIPSPIYYFNGTNDPITPLWQANYHFEGQKKSPYKVSINVIDGGHNPLDINLRDCMIETWLALTKEQSLNQDFFDLKCSMKVNVVEKKK